jgi:hypothetical protein
MASAEGGYEINTGSVRELSASSPLTNWIPLESGNRHCGDLMGRTPGPRGTPSSRCRKRSQWARGLPTLALHTAIRPSGPLGQAKERQSVIPKQKNLRLPGGRALGDSLSQEPLD